MILELRVQLRHPGTGETRMKDWTFDPSKFSKGHLNTIKKTIEEWSNELSSAEANIPTLLEETADIPIVSPPLEPPTGPPGQGKP